MKEHNHTITALHDLLAYDVQKMQNAESQLKNTLPEWALKAGSFKLKEVLQKYTTNIAGHIEKSETILVEEKVFPFSTINKVMHAFIEETNEKLALCTDAEVKDACLLAAIQEINHYKISVYGTAAAFANALNIETTANLFHEAEISEKQIVDRLSQLATYEINLKAKTPIALT